jgi:hypothetical protein
LRGQNHPFPITAITDITEGVATEKSSAATPDGHELHQFSSAALPTRTISLPYIKDAVATWGSAEKR